MELLGHLSLHCDFCLRFWNGFWYFIIIIFAVDLADKNLQHWENPWNSDDETEFRAKFKILFDGYRTMFDQSFSKSKYLSDMLRFLPGVVVQKSMGVQGMADLYKIKSDFLERLIKFTIEPLKPSPSQYIFDDYLSGFLQDRDRSQLYYCDPMLQQICVCRHFLSFLDESNAFNLQS